MESNIAGSAVSRCPLELWRMIFLAAAPPTEPLYTDALSLPYVIDGDGVVPPQAATAGQERMNEKTLYRISLVCLAWREICHPFKLRHVKIWSEKSLADKVLELHESVRGIVNGTLVRRLHLPATQLRDFRSILELVRACPRLDEFSCHPDLWGGDFSQLARMLVQVSGLTLRYIRLVGTAPSMNGAVTLIKGCPALEGLWMPRFDWRRPTDVPMDTAPSEGIALRSLHLYVDRGRQVTFLDFLATSALPNLCDLAIAYESTLPNPTPDVLPAELSSFFQAHGRKLRSVEVEEPFGFADGGMAFEVLSLCPNVESFVFDLRKCRPSTLIQAHGALRRLGCHSFFLHSIHDDPTHRHSGRVLEVVSAFCQPGFAKLEIIRCMDVDLGAQLLDHTVTQWASFMTNTGFWRGRQRFDAALEASVSKTTWGIPLSSTSRLDLCGGKCRSHQNCCLKT